VKNRLISDTLVSVHIWNRSKTFQAIMLHSGFLGCCILLLQILIWNPLRLLGWLLFILVRLGISIISHHQD